MTSATSGITQRQNDPHMLRCLGEQRALYARAKRLFGLFWLLSVPVSVVMVVASLQSPAFKPYTVVIGFLIPLLDMFWLTPRQKKLKEAAAKIQEKFDTVVLALPWNSHKVGSVPSHDVLVSGEADGGQTSSLRDWYCGHLDELPIEIGRIVCQQQNITWDSTQRRRFITFIEAVLAIVSMAVMATALWWNSSFVETLATLLPPVSPIFYFCIKHRQEHIEAADRLDKLKDTAQKLWQDALAGRHSTDEISQLSRALQDEIYDSRRRSVAVLDSVYNLFRSRLQHRFDTIVELQVAEAHEHLARRPRPTAS